MIDRLENKRDRSNSERTHHGHTADDGIPERTESRPRTMIARMDADTKPGEEAWKPATR